jgi:hypothetical protein
MGRRDGEHELVGLPAVGDVWKRLPSVAAPLHGDRCHLGVQRAHRRRDSRRMGPQARQQARGGRWDRVQRRLAVEPRQIALEEPHRGVLSCRGSARRRRRLRASWREGLLEVRRRQLHDDPAPLAFAERDMRVERVGVVSRGQQVAVALVLGCPELPENEGAPPAGGGDCSGLGGQRAHARRRAGQRGHRADPVEEADIRASEQRHCRSCARRASRRLTFRVRRRDGVVRAAAAGDRHQAREERDEAAAAGHRPWGWRVMNEPLESSY